MNLQVFTHYKMTFRNYFCTNKTKHSRMMHGKSIKVTSVYMAHPTKDKSADLPKHCYSEIISIFHFT
jgi:hypothetical protein